MRSILRSKGNVPEEEYTIPLGKAEIKKRGEDLTIIAVSRCVHEALKAANKLRRKRTLIAEIIDLRTLVPLDVEQ